MLTSTCIYLKFIIKYILQKRLHTKKTESWEVQVVKMDDLASGG